MKPGNTKVIFEFLVPHQCTEEDVVKAVSKARAEMQAALAGGKICTAYASCKNPGNGTVWTSNLQKLQSAIPTDAPSPEEVPAAKPVARTKIRRKG